jgi:hypothetical protein
VDGLHVEGVAENEGDLLGSAEIGQPIPGEDALHRHDDVLAVGSEEIEENLGVRLDVALEEDGAFLVDDDDDVHGSRVKVDPAIETVLFVVESHRAPSCEDVVSQPRPAYPGWGRHRRGPR